MKKLEMVGLLPGIFQWPRAQGGLWEELAQPGIVRRLNGRDGWAAQRNAHLRQDLVPAPEVSGPEIASDPWPDLMADDCPRRQAGGRRVGLDLIDSFLNTRGRTYRSAMSSPVTGDTARSRFSPYLAWGTVSGREVPQVVAARQRAVRGTRAGWAGSLKSFQARLAWRDHLTQKPEDEPALERRCLHSAYEGLRQDDRVRCEAWKKRETGLPFVDACMRYLATTGRLNFRMLSMVMAVASYRLWLDWRATGHHLARQFTDYDCEDPLAAGANAIWDDGH